MASILDEIVARKRVDIARCREREPVEALREAALQAPPPPPFASALRSARVGLIAEAKRRSPSAGAIREPFDPAAIVSAYERAGAQACSVLMDEPYFGGGESDFRAARAACRLPLLYKEFVVDPWQVWHARRIGASAVLLIAGVLDTAELASFGGLCREAGLEALVEVHDAAQMAMAVEAGAACVGVNNRDLRTFTVSLETTLTLAERAPPGCTLVGESGISSSEDVVRLRDGGVHAVLVGEHLLRQPDLALAVRNLMEPAWASS